MQHRKYVIVVVGVFLLNFMAQKVPAATDLPQIVFSGIYFAGDVQAVEKRFPYLNKKSNYPFLSSTFNQILKKNTLTFNLISAWGEGARKGYAEIYHPMSLAIIITDESYSKDIFALKLKEPHTQIIKNYFDVGLTAVFFTPSENKDRIEYSLPVMVEDILPGEFSEPKDIVTQFRKTYTRAARILARRLSRLNVRCVRTHVMDVVHRGGHKIARIDAGTKQGILPGIYVKLPNGISGRITAAYDKVSELSFTGSPIKTGDGVAVNVVKSDNDETYQVKEVILSSKHARGLFYKDKSFETLCAQWYSDFLADRGGAVVLPPKTGALYATGAKESILSAYNLSGSTFEFEIPDAKHQITLDINGLAKTLAKSNNVSRIWIFKAWIEANMDGRKKEVNEYITEESIVGVKEINSKEVFRYIIQQTLAKLAKKKMIFNNCINVSD